MIWLIGHKGLLGTELAMLLHEKGIEYIGTGSEVDIKDRDILLSFISKCHKKINWIINSAAYTNVEKAEEDEHNCRLINTDGAANIAWCANKISAKMVHFSTDYVFDGQSTEPYTEDAVSHPVNVYGLSKIDGETGVMEENPYTCIIRTAWLYGKYGSNFVSTVQKLMVEKDCFKVVNDQIGSPTWTRDLCEAVTALIKKADENPKEFLYGIYNFSGDGETSRYNFAMEIYRQCQALGIIKKDCEIIPCSSAEYPSNVKRPLYSVLDKSKIKRNLGIKIPMWHDSLKKYLELCAG